MMITLTFRCWLTDGCLSHKTAVAAGALSQFLRYMLVPGSPFYQRHTRLTGVNYLLNPQSLRSQSLQPGILAPREEAQDAADRKREGDDAGKGNDNVEIDPKNDYDDNDKQLPEIDAIDDDVNRHGGDEHRALGGDGGVPAPKDDGVDNEAKQKDDSYVYDPNKIDVANDEEERKGEISLDEADKHAFVDGNTSNVTAMSLFKAYVLLLLVMFVLVVSMCKFLRRHRVLIRYRHR